MKNTLLFLLMMNAFIAQAQTTPPGSIGMTSRESSSFGRPNNEFFADPLAPNRPLTAPLAPQEPLTSGALVVPQEERENEIPGFNQPPNPTSTINPSTNIPGVPKSQAP